MSAKRKLVPVYELHQFRIVNSTVMVLDDQNTGRLVFAEIIKSIDRKINILMFSDATEAIEYARNATLDLVLTDYTMPGLDGIETIRQLRRHYSHQQLPIVMTTVVSNGEVLYRAFEAGASDYLIRPVDPTECRVRCQNLLNLRQQLSPTVTRAHAGRACRSRETGGALARNGHAVPSGRCRGPQGRTVTGAHLKRMARYSALIARSIGLDDDQTETIELAAPMHDIGKISIPDSIMQKRGQLTAEEISIMKTHPQIGYAILKGSPSLFLQAAAVIAHSHHEKFDGSGYPLGLKGQNIPLEARIVALAEVFDTLISERPYKQAWEWDAAVNYIVEQKSKHFDPELVNVFLENISEARAIQRLLADAEQPDLA